MFTFSFNTKPLIDQFKNFTTFGLIYKASSLLEKIFWALFAIGGTLWIGEVVLYSVVHWNENPILVTKTSKDLSDIKAPAVTFCSKGMSEYTLVERFGNYLDPTNLNLPEEVFLLRFAAIKVYVDKIYRNYDGLEYYYETLGDYQEDHCDEDKRCKVNSLYEYSLLSN